MTIPISHAVRLVCAENFLAWFVNNAGECLADHPNRLAALRDFLAMPEPEEPPNE